VEKAGRVAPFKSLDILRGLAALWVVMCHAATHYVGGTRLEKWPIYNFSMRGQLGVMLFFLISGYCIVGAAYSAFASGKKVRRYAFERARRIYPPYFFATLLALVYAGGLIQAQRWRLIPEVNHLIQLKGGALFWLSNFLLFQSEAGQRYINVVFWSLCYEVAFYVIIGVILLIAQRLAKRWNTQAGMTFLSLAVGALTVESLVWQIATGNAGVFPLGLWYQFGLGGLFFLAVEIRSSEFAGYSEKLHLLNRVMGAVVVALVAVFAGMRSIGGGDIGHPNSRQQCCAVILYLAMFWALRRVDGRLAHHRILSPLFWLGSFSYSLYLVHPYILGFVDVPARRLGLIGNWYVMNWTLQILAGVFLGWLFYLAVERHFVSSRQKRRIATELAAAGE